MSARYQPRAGDRVSWEENGRTREGEVWDVGPGTRTYIIPVGTQSCLILDADLLTYIHRPKWTVDEDELDRTPHPDDVPLFGVRRE